MLKRAVLITSFCSLLLMPLSGWALDDGEKWRNLSPKERENILRNYQRWQNLPPQDKEHLREEWDRWQRLPQDRRDKIKRRYEEQRRKRSDD
jgi:hypothetical protein